MEHKKKYLFIGILLIIVIFSSGTYAIWQWSTTVAERTKVVFEVSEESKGFSCSADGGGNITSNDVVLAPAKCTSGKYAIRREVKVMPQLELEGIRIKLNLNLDIKKIGTGLSGSENFKYALTTNPNSCVDDLVETGNFKGKKAGDSVDLIIDKEYSQSMEELYYLYVWLDEAETSTSTMNQPFDLALSGTCAGMFEDLKVTFDVNGGEYVPIENIESTNFSTYGEYEYIVPYDGLYKLEAWGASGGGDGAGAGGYTSGLIELTEGEKIYAYVGQSAGNTSNATFNGGGQSATQYSACGGGGATDFRLIKGSSYSEISSLASRIMVAGGGGGMDYYSSVGSAGGYAGGLIAYNGGYYRSGESCSYSVSAGGTQVSGGSGGSGALVGGAGTFGIGGSAINTNNHGGGGGGGYYGGGSGSYNCSVVGSGAGGSSFISGHTGCVAITSETEITPRVGTNSASCSTGTTDNLCSVHYSGKKFTNTVILDGYGYLWSNVKSEQSQMPKPSGGFYSFGSGQSGNGYARITLLNYLSTTVDYDGKYGELPVAEKEGYEFIGWSTIKDNFNTLVTSDSVVNAKTAHTLYALFAPVYNVSFDSQGGEFDTPLETIDYTTVGEHLYTVPYSGDYKLEVWGASGGTVDSTYSGGYGGYSTGIISLDGGSNLYVNVGGSGTVCGGMNCVVNGGYNGGGAGVGLSACGSSVYAGSGGGATHISTVSGTLSSLSSNKSSILIVAGGGGGGNYCNTANYARGGSGGGITGVSSINLGAPDFAANGGSSATGGTQSSGYSFGLGGGSTDSTQSVGGGGGYYGGKNSGINGAGGGSGYIGNTLLENKLMYCYNCTTSTDSSTLTYSTTNVSSTATSNYAKSGSGAARITILTSAKEVTYYENYGVLPIPTKEFYSFVGWNTKSDGTGEFIDNDTKVINYSAHTLYAIWESNFNISYSVNGGIIDSTTTSVNGNTTYNWTTNNDIISLNGNSNFYKTDDLSNIDLYDYNDTSFMNISKDGYGVVDDSEWICLEGCKVENSVYSQDTSYKYSDFCDENSSCNVVLGVNWKQVYMISYDANGGSNVPANQEKLYGETIYITSDIPKLDGYVFSGWSISPTATTPSYTSGSDFTINDNITLYAVWIEITSPIESYSCANGSVGSAPYYLTYTGNCTVIDDGNGDWRVKFLSTGTHTLTFSGIVYIDVFLVGGGGGGGSGYRDYDEQCVWGGGGGGGGGGYTQTKKNIFVTAGISYPITVGVGGSSVDGANGVSGGASSAFDLIANGGQGGSSSTGYSSPGPGGSGGNNGGAGGNGDGGAGGSYGGGATCEFGEGTSSGCTKGITYAYSGGGGGGGRMKDCYAYNGGAGGNGGGGAGGKDESLGSPGTANSGGGGGGGSGHWNAGGASGGSGIVVIRNKR